MNGVLNGVVGGLYALLDIGGCVPTTEALRFFDLLVEGGIQTIQIRGKSLSDRDLLEISRAIIERRPAGVRVFVNDRADIARVAGADGVHVGQGDISPTDLRSWCPSPFRIGLSCHTLEDAVRAHALNVASNDHGSNVVDYIGFGPIFETSTKARPAPTVGLTMLREVVARVHPLPVVAIGGITIERIPAVWATGAAAIAMASGLTNTRDANANAHADRDADEEPDAEWAAESARARIRRAAESLLCAQRAQTAHAVEPQ